MSIQVFKDSRLPFVELRYLKVIPECTKMHLHDEVTITAVEVGELNIIFNDENYHLTPNEIMIINQNISHCATLNDTDSKGCFVLYLDTAYLKELALEFKAPYAVQTQSGFITLCKTLLSQQHSMIEKQEETLLFCMESFAQCDTTSSEERMDETVFQIKAYLDEHYLEDIDLPSIAQQFDITEIHCIRLFKNRFGIPVHSYVLNKRVHHAKALLNQNIPIVEVALQSGFFDQSHLNRSFKRIFQMTPKQFQKNLLS
ncbi:AraC family transcriptional regulator [Candidatus Marinarcus aquaticus]|uniref:AraC family transcriptional regulator n=1 Tax=Candidatus Marinarcus aquaticus TaxID=2044504 RepID=A0A4Q0XWU5_9BACT|nr:AraC family transcriptional regulator [Candidatus Marinarcus aquaticus]RXJ60749.1 AraC family transcriptional regulator [Candidatus Marinarcus aquaticus]